MRIIRNKRLMGVMVLSAAVLSCQKTGPDTGTAGARIIPRLTSSVLTKAGTAVPEQDTLFKYSDEDISVALFEEDNLTGIGEVPTKGAVITTSGLNADGKQFRMDAWLGSANRYNGTQDGDGHVYDTADKDNYHFISSETVTYGSGSWSMGAEHIWRNSVPTSFWSLHPVSATGWTVTLPGETASDDEQKQLSFIYTIPSLTDGAGAEGQPDLCVAFSHRTWEDGSDNFVDIDFKHALSAVYFDITDIPEGLSVTKIAIKGLKGSGSCTVNGSTSGTSSAKGVTFGWTTSGGNCSWSQSFGDIDFETSGGRRVTKESGSKIFMLIPQTLTADTKLAVTFYDGTNSTTREASIGDGTTSFNAGKRYTFRLGVKDGVLTAGLPDPYNGDPLGGTDVGGEGLDPYNGDSLGGTDVGGEGLDPYNGDPLGGTDVGGEGLDPYNGDPLGGTDIGGEGLDPYNGDPLGGTDIGGEGLDPYNGDPLGGDGHDYVDLGLSVLWATCNVGATSPEEYGDYFQWAGTADITSITVSWANCPYHSGSSGTVNWTKYVTSGQSSYWSGTGSPDNKTVLDPSDDAAHESWGDDWRIPTAAEYEELIANCTCTWKDNYNGANIKGWVFTSNKPGYTGNSIFLPAGGRINESGIDYVGEDVRYWTSTLGTENGGSPDCACGIFSENGEVKIDGYGKRFNGRNVRPVMDKD